MNRKCILGYVFVFMLVVSGPLYIPFVYAVSSIEPKDLGDNDSIIGLNATSAESYNETRPSEPSPHTRAPIKAYADTQTGESPLYVKLTGKIDNPNLREKVIIYKWDFDGDGETDYSNLETCNTSHVYYILPEKNIQTINKTIPNPIEESNIQTLNTTSEQRKENITIQDTVITYEERNVTISPRLTVIFKDGSRSTKTQPITISSVDYSKWIKLKDYGFTKIGITNEGKIIVFDQTDMLSFTLMYNETTLETEHYQQIDDRKIQISYETTIANIETNVTFGLTGRAQISIMEKAKPGTVLQEKPRIKLPKTTEKGRLEIKKHETIDNDTYRKYVYEAGNHDPWKDAGLVPYGEYFETLNEYVSTQTGYLTVIQTDLVLPGRGMDLAIKRVYTPPAKYENNEPASEFDYSYTDYQYAPMGKGWQLGFPWIEKDGGKPAYIRLSNGQRYKIEEAGENGTQYDSGDYFTLYNYTNGNYTLYTKDGTRYRFDSEYKIKDIRDTNYNQITFTYDQSDHIETITDTVGRSVTLNYNVDGLVSKITSGKRVIEYGYRDGEVSGKTLSYVKDPLGRFTNFSYHIDYLISKIDYPTGAYSLYDYYAYQDSGVVMYRVKDHTKYDGADQHIVTQYMYEATFDTVTEVTIHESYTNKNPAIKTVISYSQNKITEESFDYTPSEEQINKVVKSLTKNRRRIHVEKYPGGQKPTVNLTKRYDNWGNLIYHRDYADHEKHYSYVNTNSSNIFVDSGGNKVCKFTDSFYSFTVNNNTHNLVMGKAESPDLEKYHKYSYEGNLEESKRLCDDWSITKNTFDEYGNLVKSVDPEYHTVYYEYNSSYQGAYLTAKHQPLDSRNITEQYQYNFTTGDLNRITDAKGNQTDYTYDVYGRITSVTYPNIADRAVKTATYNDTITFASLSPNKTTVDTTTGKTIRTFHDVGRSWVMWVEEDELRYSSENDGEWSDASTVPSTNGEASLFDLYFDGMFVHISFTYAAAEKDIYYMRGMPVNDGTINWDDRVKAVETNYAWARVTNIVVTDNYVWVSYTLRISSDNKEIYVTCSSNMDGGWTQRNGFPIKFHDGRVFVDQELAGLSDDKVYFAWSPDGISGKLWDGSSWGSIETVTNYDYITSFDLSSWGNDVWAVFHSDDRDATYSRKRTYVSGSWGSTDEMWYIYDGHIRLSRGHIYGTLYAFACIGNGPRYKYYNGTSWGDDNLLEYDDQAYDYPWTLRVAHEPWDGEISLVYAVDGVSDYDIIHNYLPLSKTASFSYVKITDENEHVTRRYYDGLGRTARLARYNSSSLYSTENYTYNWLDLVKTRTTPEGHIYEYDYNALGKLTTQINPDDSVYQIKYNHTLNTQTIIDEEGRKRVLTYDSMNRLVNVREYNDTDQYYLTTYTYDGAGNLVSIEDALNRSTEYYYDQLNRLIKTVYPDSSQEAYTYDKVGNLVQKINRNNAVTAYQYDSLDRLVNKSYHQAQYTTDEQWLTGWNYRTPIQIMGTTDGNQSDYQMRFKVYKTSGESSGESIYLGSKVNSDFSDIRFTGSDKETLLSHWIGRKYGDYAVVWVKVDSIPEYPDTCTIYLYYGNSTASSTSDGASTFLEYDGFEDYSVGTELDFGNFVKIAQTEGYTLAVSSQKEYSGSKSFLSVDSGTGWNKFYWDVSDRLTGKWRVHSAFYVYDYSDNHMKPGYIAEGLRGVTNIRYTDEDFAYYNGGWHLLSNSSSLETWHTVEQCIDLDGSTYDIRLDDTWYCDLEQDNNQGADDLCEVYVSAAGSEKEVSCHIDDFFVARYADPEPTVYGIGLEEFVNTSAIDVGSKIGSELYSYDDLGNLLSSDYNGTGVSYGYDARNRLLKECFNVSGDVYTVKYSYDDASNIVAMTYPDESPLSLGYDALNRLKEVDDYANISYTVSDNVDTVTYGNGVSTVYDYDNRRRPVRILVDLNFTDDVWLGDWKYRKKITLTGTTAGVQTDYPILIKVHHGSGTDSGNNVYCNGKPKNDFGDIRFTESDGVTELSYWIESKTDGNEALIWIKLDSIPESPDTVEVCMYYGYGAVSTTSDPTGIFTFFDHFDGTTLNLTKWTVDWDSGPAGTVAVDDSILEVKSASGDSGYGQAIKSDANFNVPYILRAAVKSDKGCSIGIWDKDNLYPKYGHYHQAFAMFFRGVDEYTVEADGTDDDWESTVWTTTKYNVFEIRRKSSGESDFYVNGFQRNPSQDLHTDETGMIRVVSVGDGKTVLTDWVLIRKYADPEPGITSTGPEEAWYESSRLLDLFISYDKSGSVTEIIDGPVTESYGYDLLDRLNHTTGPWGSVTYAYDPVGNRLSKAVQGGGTTSYTYDEVNRITSATGMGFTWDDNGNLLYWDDGVDEWNYTYDPADRLINVKKNGAFSARYTYDADGRRVRSIDGSSVIDYMYSGLNVIDEVSGGAHEKHVYAGGMHIASNNGGTIEYYHQDHLGSTRLKTNSTAGVVYESNYEPYGPGSGETGSEDYRYTGKQEDPTGLYYYGARYYDPATGRFTTLDKVSGGLANPQSLNRYSYCRNNPHKYTDPDGNDPELVIFLLKWTVEAGVAGTYEAASYSLEYPDDFEGQCNRFRIEATSDIFGSAVRDGTNILAHQAGIHIPQPVLTVEKRISKGMLKRKIEQDAWVNREPGYNHLLERPDDYNRWDAAEDIVFGGVSQYIQIFDRESPLGIAANKFMIKVSEDVWDSFQAKLRRFQSFTQNNPYPYITINDI